MATYKKIPVDIYDSEEEIIRKMSTNLNGKIESCAIGSVRTVLYGDKGMLSIHTMDNNNIVGHRLYKFVDFQCDGDPDKVDLFLSVIRSNYLVATEIGDWLDRYPKIVLGDDEWPEQLYGMSDQERLQNIEWHMFNDKMCKRLFEMFEQNNR